MEMLQCHIKKAQEAQKLKESWGQGASFEAKARTFWTRGALVQKMLENHSQTIFLTNNLDDSVKQVIRHHDEPCYSILCWVRQF